MELIPILSTIILVATISTFILAIGAYILYKIREGRVKISHHRKEKYLEADYFVPKEKKEHKIFIEEVIEQKTKPEKREAINEQLKNTGEKELQTKFRVVEDLGKNSMKGSVNFRDVEMPKLKFEKYTFNPETLSLIESSQDVIKWR